MNKYVLSFVIASLCFVVVYSVSSNHENLDRFKRIIAEGEEKDLPQLTRIKRVRRDADAETAKDDDIRDRIKRARKETKAITHTLERALTRQKRIDVDAEGDKDPEALDRVKRYRRDEGEDGLIRTKRVRKDVADDAGDEVELRRVKRVRRDIERPEKRAAFGYGDHLNRVKRLYDDFEEEPALKRFKRVRRSAESPDAELTRLRKRSGHKKDAEKRLLRMKRM